MINENSGDDELPESCPRCHATGDFKCANNRCIPLSSRCNAINDCGDNSDESTQLCSQIPQRACTESEFECRNKRCIKSDWKCDHSNDCGDNSDESTCVNHDCGPNKFKCRSGHCIAQTQHCDGIRNCLDFSDETSCPPRYPNGQYCLNTSFTCNNTFCVNLNWMCDGDNDCGDQSDELLSVCSGYNCTKENLRFRCRNGMCIHLYSLCDGFHDCTDGSDEEYAGNGACKRPDVAVCGPDEFKCAASHRCIPVGFVCDEDLDCGEEDQSDELGCFLGPNKFKCELNGSLVCEHTCTDLPENGFYCSCHHGFQMVKINTTFAVETGKLFNLCFSKLEKKEFHVKYLIIF